ncbi:UDP-3-O-(3-hydroxymyristoyl)glucosamine N-acyltransferase [Legionella sp. km772]|uniref:UDP-3-O-(3-hydroxymyristoyl)glucosamine N-acyltransferase n=1 Tax=Legionella sp. km772 TaxID=2498111 RepID=UPI000F8EB90E|nr:UDP-3-O-(3-hydroxymyristoyl)glucosamine N-acyltransferase [Legionella sp. km772]RUR13651.1 UDP-3-O-(3-hydroxymyristoyl)glucosamine N-acyltransferase [Legionella sp. km772]
MNDLSGFTLEQLARLVDGVAHGNAQYAISSLSSLTRAQASHITYFDNPLLKDALRSTQAGIIVLKEEHLAWCPSHAIIVSDPLAAIKQIATLFTPSVKPAFIDPSATIHPSVQIGHNVSIGPYAVVGENVQLADGVHLGAHSCIHNSVTIGKNSYLDCQVTVHSNTQIGADVVVNAGVVLGAAPYNYVKEHGHWQQGLSLGGLIIADKVHLGANTVIDRGAVGDTYLGQGVCIDNLVHIAHDVYIGAHTAIAGCAVLGAHVIIGNDCIIGGASCLAANISLTDDVVISGMSTVNKSLTKSGIYSSGTLIHEHQRWRKNAARFRRLDDYITKLTTLERKINSEN